MYKIYTGAVFVIFLVGLSAEVVALYCLRAGVSTYLTDVWIQAALASLVLAVGGTLWEHRP